MFGGFRSIFIVAFAIVLLLGAVLGHPVVEHPIQKRSPTVGYLVFSDTLF